MGFTEAVRSVFNKYGDFSGRASRSEYWFWTLFVMLLFAAGVIVMSVTQTLLGEIAANIFLGIAAIAGLFLLVIPSLAVSVRRLHDTNSSGWWYLITLVPYVGGLILFAWFCIKGTVGDNRFGPDPLQGDVAEAFT